MTASQSPFDGYDDVRHEKAMADAAETAADDADAKAYIRRVEFGPSDGTAVSVIATTYSRAGEPDDLDDPDIYLYIRGKEFAVRLARRAESTEFAAAILKAKPEIIEEETR